MRAYAPEYELINPDSLDMALRLLAREPGLWRPIAGGTDLMVLFEAGKLPYRRLINLRGIVELRGIETSDSSVSIGALTTYTEVRRSQTIETEFPLLARAASWTGAVATQNRGTLAGNIANASPAADSPPALLVYDAEIELLSARGSRRIPYASFHVGYKSLCMSADEIIARIHLPRTTADSVQYLRKVGTRRAQAIAKVALAGLATLRGGVIDRVRIALASVAPVPVRCLETERVLVGRRADQALIGAARAKLASEIAPISDIRSTDVYRMRVARNLLEEFLEMLTT